MPKNFKKGKARKLALCSSFTSKTSIAEIWRFVRAYKAKALSPIHWHGSGDFYFFSKYSTK